MTIASNLKNIQDTIAKTARDCGRKASSIKLIAVSKRHPASRIEEAIQTGQVYFGENYIQEAVEKKQQLGDTAKFHFIGHLQSNKAKQAAEIFHMIETVDRIKLAKALNKHLEKLGRKLDILIQVNIGEDPNKSGTSPEEAGAILKDITKLPHIRPLGLMTIPPFATNNEKTRVHFSNLYKLSNELAQQELFTDNNNVELSMGMSQDFTTAIEEGATIIRVGTAIFGPRP